MSLILSGTDGLSDVDGTAATPAIRGTDANTGIFFPAADTIAFSEGGVEAARIDSSGNVGIGTSSPSTRLTVAGTTTINTATDATAGLVVKTFSAAGGIQPIANFQRSDAAVSTQIGYDGSTGDCFFGTTSNHNLYFISNNTERVRIDSSGNLGIGTSAPTDRLDIRFATGTGNVKAGVVGGNNVKLYNTTGDISLLSSDPSSDVILDSQRSVIFKTANTERMRVNAGSPVLCLSGGNTSATGAGIAFPATQSASNDANTLDDYEEGTFTPTIVGSTSAGTGTYSSQVGTYTRVGRAVSFRLLIGWSAHTGTGSMLAGGLPFASSSVTDTLTAITVGGINNVTLSANHVGTALLFTNTTQISFYQTPVGGGSDSTVPVDTSASTVLSGTYFV